MSGLCGKRLTCIFSFSHNVFYPSPTNFNFSAKFNLLSANAFNLDQSKNCFVKYRVKQVFFLKLSTRKIVKVILIVIASFSWSRLFPDCLTLYQMTIFWTCPNSKHLQTTNEMLRRYCFLFLIGRKNCGKRSKCWLPAFSPFPKIFPEDFFLKVAKSQDCLVKG